MKIKDVKNFPYGYGKIAEDKASEKIVKCCFPDKDEVDYIKNITNENVLYSFLNQHSNLISHFNKPVDQEIILESSKNFPQALSFATPDLLKDKNFALRAVSIRYENYHFLTTKLQKDKDVIKKAIESDAQSIKIIKNASIKTIIDCLETNPMVFSFLSDDYLTNSQIILKVNEVFGYDIVSDVEHITQLINQEVSCSSKWIFSNKAIVELSLSIKDIDDNKKNQLIISLIKQLMIESNEAKGDISIKNYSINNGFEWIYYYSLPKQLKQMILTYFYIL